MKKTIIISLLIIGSWQVLISQNYCVTDKVPIDNSIPACCNGNINTDYNFPFNPERSDLQNQFNWLTPPSTSTGQSFISVNRNNSVVNIDHPFLNDLSKYWWYSNFKLGDQPPYLTNTMHPKYGWQLLYHNFGLNLFTQSIATNVPQRFNPIMIYYNKYSGKMRLFSSPGEGNSFDETSVRMGFVTNPSLLNLKVSGLLAHNAPIANALDRKTAVAQITASMPFASVYAWAGTDIQTAYDPCVCDHESRFKLDFYDQDFSQVFMSGNIVGINRPLDNSGNSPLKFGENFISSVYADYTNSTNNIKSKPKNGMLVYNDVNSIVAGAYVSPEMQLLGKGLDILSGIDAITGIKLDILPLGKAIGKGLSWASKQVNPPSPQITFLEAQGAFSGEIFNQNNSGGYSDLELLNPGSFHNFRKTNPWTIEPLYNEALGLFALLKSPKLVYYYAFEPDLVGLNPRDNAMRAINMGLNEPIEFVLNPTADIDLEKTKISAAIEFDLYNTFGQPIEMRDLSNNIVDARDFLKPTFMQLSSDFPTEDIYDPSSSNPNNLVRVNSQKRIFSTYVMPINKLHTVMFRHRFQGASFAFWEKHNTPNNPKYPRFRLRIYVDYVFKPNQYGEVNRSSQTYLYDVDPYIQGLPLDANPNNNLADYCCDGKTNLCFNPTIRQQLGTDFTLNTTNYSSSQTINGNNITINGNLTTSNGAVVTILYRGGLTINPTSIISPNIIIKYNDFDVHDDILTVPSESYIKNTFCKNSYKANQLKNAINQHSTRSKSKSDLPTTISLHPNPAADYTRLVIDQPVGDKAMVRVYDMVGREVYSQEMLELDKGKTSLEISTQELHRGIYIVKVIHGELEQSLKLEVAK